MALKISKKVTIITSTVLVTVGLGAGLVAKFGNGLERKYIDHKLGTDSTYSDVLDSISQKSEVDDILRPTNYKDYLNGYEQYRASGDYENARLCLIQLYRYTLQAKLCEYEGIDFEDVKDLQTWIDVDRSTDGKAKLCAQCTIVFDKEESEQSANNIVTSRIIETTSNYKLKGQLFDMVYDMSSLEQSILSSGPNKNLSEDDKFEQLDAAYIALQRYLVTTEVKDEMFSSETLKNSYSLTKGFKL